MDRTASTENDSRRELDMLRARVAEFENTSDEFRRIADAAREGEPRFLAAIEQTLGPLLLINPSDGRIVEVNKLACETLGYSKEGLLERNASQVDPVYGQDNLAALIDSLRANSSLTIVSTHRHKKGATIPVEIRLGLVEVLGTPHLLSLARCKPQHVEAERALRDSDARFRSLIDTIPHGVQEIDIDGVITLSNTAHDRMHGYADGELVGKTIFDLLASDAERDTLREYLAELVREQPAATPYFTSHRTRDGRIIDVQVDWTYKRDAQGRLTGFVSVITDFTDRKNAEEKLRLSQFALENCSDPVCWIRKDGRFSYVNKATCELFGYSPDELVSMTVHDIDPNFPNEIWPQHWDRMKNAGSLTFESTCRTKDGRAFPIEVTTNFVEYLGQEYVWAFARDITARKQTEEALKRSEAFLNATGRMARIGGWEVDSETEAIRWTEETYRIHELPLDYKPTMAEAIGFFHEEDRPKLQRAIRQAIDHGKPYDLEIRFITATGKPLWTHTICVPHVVNGKIVRLTGTFQDITDRKHAEEEKERLEAHLRHSQKMEAIGQLAGGVAHDFNNYLTAILANADLLGGMMKDGLDEKSTEMVKAGLREIKNAGKRAALLTRQLVAFSRKDRTKADVLDLREVIGEAEQILRRMIREEIDFNVEIKQDAHRILADAGQIEQIVMNLVLNARDAIKGPGNLTVQCVNVELDDAHVVMNIGAKPGPHVMLAVSDNGIGMSRKTIEHIFEPFFTTKPRGKGTGLGLATVYGIAQQAGAHISVESQPGKGSTFRIYFPSVENE